MANKANMANMASPSSDPLYFPRLDLPMMSSIELDLGRILVVLLIHLLE
jgi:hypothetical protein